ncbi:MAG: hypothetical protein AAGA31_17545 [Bacteroidota bacterium]
MLFTKERLFVALLFGSIYLLPFGVDGQSFDAKAVKEIGDNLRNEGLLTEKGVDEFIAAGLEGSIYMPTQNCPVLASSDSLHVAQILSLLSQMFKKEFEFRSGFNLLVKQR